jgi:uncharacterized protein
MRLNEVEFSGPPPIDGYGQGGFRIAGRAHPSRWISRISPRPWRPRTTTIVLLIGMGADPTPLAPELRAALEGAGAAPEPMATPAACRTYNVLIAEERRVAAALIPV